MVRHVDEMWETGLAAVVSHVLLNELGVIATAARTLLERWSLLSAPQRETLLSMIDESVGRGIGQLESLAKAYIQ